MPIADAWAFLMDIESTVTCFPGATLTEIIDDDHYTGRVTIKLGPLSMVFYGKLHIENRDETAYSAGVRATWTESKGRGHAITVTRYVLQPAGEGTVIKMDTDVQLAGQVAQYGRGAGMIADISAQLVSQFADNLRARIDARGAAHDNPHRQISGARLIGRALLNRVKSGSE